MRDIRAAITLSILLLLLDVPGLMVWKDPAAHAPVNVLRRPVASQSVAGDIRRRQTGDGVWQIELLSAVQTVDRTYKSMQGPLDRRILPILADQPDQAIWVTACRVQMVAEDGVTPISDRFTCHTNVDRRPRQGADVVGLNQRDDRMFTLSQGQMAVEFPPGFGIPLAADTELEIVMQVLNLTPLPTPIRIRHRVRLTVVEDRKGTASMVPLYQQGLSALKPIDSRMADRQSMRTAHRTASSSAGRTAKPGSAPIDTGELCLPGRMVSILDQEFDRRGRRVTGHWVLPPGRETLRSPVTQMLDLQSDTTVHFIAVHLHPFAKSLELFDVTAGRRVFISHAHQRSKFPGLSSVETLSSIEGLRLHADHEYVLNSVYDNTSGVDQDAMAVLYLYLREPDEHVVPSDGLFPDLPWDADGEPRRTVARSN